MTEISPIRFFCINIFLSNFFRVLDRSYKKVPQKNREISNSDILYIRKLVRIGSNARIPGDSHYKNIVLAFLKNRNIKSYNIKFLYELSK